MFSPKKRKAPERVGRDEFGRLKLEQNEIFDKTLWDLQENLKYHTFMILACNDNNVKAEHQEQLEFFQEITITYNELKKKICNIDDAIEKMEDEFHKALINKYKNIQLKKLNRIKQHIENEHIFS